MGNKPSQAVATNYTTTGDDGFVVVNPTVGTSYILVGSNASPLNQIHEVIKANNNAYLRYPLTNRKENFFRYVFSVPIALYTYVKTTAIMNSKETNFEPAHNLLAAARSEFPEINQAEIFDLHESLIFTMFRLKELLKRNGLFNTILPEIKRSKLTKKSQLFKFITESNVDERWLLNRAWQDKVMQQVIQSNFDHNLRVLRNEELDKIRSLITNNDLIFEEDLKRLLVGKPGGLTNKRWAKLKADKASNEWIEILLWKQYQTLQKRMKLYAEDRYDFLPESDKQIYDDGMEKIITRIERESDSTKFYAKFPSLALLKKIDYMANNAQMWSQMSNSYMQSASVLFNKLVCGTVLSQELYYPALLITMTPLALTFTKVASAFLDCRIPLREFLVVKYKENLSLNTFNSFMPNESFYLLQQPNRPIQAVDPNANFFSSNLSNFNYLIDGKFKFSLLVMLSGLMLRGAINGACESAGLDDNYPGMALHAALIIFFELYVMTKTLTYARTLDHALTPSNVRVHEYETGKERGSAMIESVCSTTSNLIKFAKNSSQFWHRPKTKVAITKATVELIEEEKKVVGHRKTL
jgi:hypothetical protein